MKIVNVEDFFHPDAGYQINILSKYLVALGHEVTIITSQMEKVPTTLTSFFGRENIEERDKAYSTRYGVKILRLPIRSFVSGRAVFTKELFTAIQKEHPDVMVVHGNDTLTGMRYLLKYKKMGYPLVMDSHMLEMASTNKFNKLFRRFYKHFFTPMITKNEIPVIRTQDDPYVEKCLGIPLAQAPWISYGSDTMLFYPNAEIKKSFRAKHGISNDNFVIVYTGKLDESKGGMLLAKTFRDKFQSKKNVVLIVVGNTSGEYGKNVEQIFSMSENRIIRFSTQKYCDLARFYQAADLSVFAKQCSLSFYDAQACGLPVLSEDNNINVDRCSHENGWNFKADDVQDFRAKIEAVVNMDRREYQKVSDCAYRYIVESFNYKDKVREYEAVLLREYQKNKDKIL